MHPVVPSGPGTSQVYESTPGWARLRDACGEAMSTWKKIAIGVAAVILLSAIVGFTVYQSHKNVVTVQTGKVQRQDLAAVVSAPS